MSCARHGWRAGARPETAGVRAGILLILAAAVAGCAVPAPPPDGVRHVVLVWLKEPGNPAHRRTVVEVTRDLAHLPGVLSVDAGPVVPGDRPIVDDSFDVGICFRFESVAAMRRYVVHPLHVKLVKERLRPIVRRLQVYDFTIR